MNQNAKESIQVESYNVFYHQQPVVWNINLSIPTHRLIGIAGPNGAGKSTLVKSMLGFIPSTSGNVLFMGKKLSEIQDKIAYIPQKSSVDWQFPITSLELVLMGCYRRLGWLRRPAKKDRELAFSLLDKLQMREFAQRQIGELSGGQQQRLFIARALMQEADIFFFDEPFTGIDLTTEHFLLALFQQLVKEGKTIFVVHHDLSKIQQYFDWVILLNTRLIASGPIQETLTMENLIKTYGSKEELLEKALFISKEKLEGLQ